MEELEKHRVRSCWCGRIPLARNLIVRAVEFPPPPTEIYLIASLARRRRYGAKLQYRKQKCNVCRPMIGSNEREEKLTNRKVAALDSSWEYHTRTDLSYVKG